MCFCLEEEFLIWDRADRQINHLSTVGFSPDLGYVSFVFFSTSQNFSIGFCSKKSIE